MPSLTNRATLRKPAVVGAGIVHRPIRTRIVRVRPVLLRRVSARTSFVYYVPSLRIRE